MLKELKELIFGKPKPKGRRVDVVKVTPELLQKIPPLLKKELGMKDAIIVKYENIINEQSKKIQELEGKKTSPEMELVKKVVAKKKVMEKKKALLRKPIFFRKPFAAVTTWDKKFYTDGRMKLKYLCGLEAVETENGFGYNILVKNKPDDKKFSRIVFKMPLEAIFEDPEYFVSSLLTGNVRTRFDSKGKYHAPAEFKRSAIERTVFPIINDASLTNNEKVRYLGEIMINNPEFHRQLMYLKKSYEDKITDMNEELNGVYNNLNNLAKREAKLQARLRDALHSVEIANTEVDMTESLASHQLQKFRNIALDYANLLSSASDITTGRLMAESVAESTMQGYQKLKNLRESELGIDKSDLAFAKEREKLRADIKLTQELFPTKAEIVRETKPVKPEKEKEKEK